MPALIHKLLRDEITYADSVPFRRLMMYQIDLPVGYGAVDILDIDESFYISNITAECITANGFQENAKLALLDTEENAVLGYIMVRAGKRGKLSISSPNYNPALQGPTKLRVQHISGIPTSGTLRLVVTMYGPLTDAPSGSGNVPDEDVVTDIPNLTTTLGNLQDFIDGYQEGDIPLTDGPTLFRALGRILAGKFVGANNFANFVAEGIANRLIGGAPADADTFAEILLKIQSIKIITVANKAERDLLTNLEVGTLVLVEEDEDTGLRTLFYASSIDPIIEYLPAIEIDTAFLINRGNHQGEQGINTITGLAALLETLATSDALNQAIAAVRQETLQLVESVIDTLPMYVSHLELGGFNDFEQGLTSTLNS